MKHHRWIPFLRVVSLLFILAAGGLVLLAEQQLRQIQDILPANSQWGVVNVGGLTVEQARQRVLAIYLSPIELNYQNERIQASAERLGFRVDLPDNLENFQSNSSAFSFWAYLWNKPQQPKVLPIEFSLDETQLRAYLQDEIASRYDISSIPPLPLPGSSRFSTGVSGRHLDVEASVARFQGVLRDPFNRKIELVVKHEPASQVGSNLLKAVLINELKEANFNGIAEIFAYHLTEQQVVHFAVADGQEVSAEIAFSAASTIKIPILLTALMQIEPPFPDEFIRMAERMMVYSENPPADQMMETYLGSTLAPLKVTEFLQNAGFRNTFLAGYFYLGAPLLRRFETPANQRVDINLNPDVYNQTTAGDMGQMLRAIYSCAESNQGVLVEISNGQLTSEKCAFLLEMMKRNRIGVLGQAGLPEGIPFAHKHGWSEESDGLLHTISDAGIVFGPQTDYVLVIFLYDPQQLLFEPANMLMARLSQRIFNAWNPDFQVEWNFGKFQYR